MATATQDIHTNSEAVKLSLVKFEEVQPETLTMVEEAEAFIIENDEMLVVAEQRSAAAHKRKKFIEGVFKPMKASAKELKDSAAKNYTEVNKLIARATEPCMQAKDIYGKKSVAYRAERERQIKEETRKRELEAKRIAEEETLRAAEHAEAMGDKEEAETILKEGISTARDVAPPTSAGLPSPKDVCYVEEWTGEVFDFMALVKAVAAGEQPITYLNGPHQSNINRAATSQKEKMNIPGVRLHYEKKQRPTGR